MQNRECTGYRLGIAKLMLDMVSLGEYSGHLPHFWDLIALDSILQTWGELFKSVNELRYLGVEDMPHGFLIESCLMDVENGKDNY